MTITKDKDANTENAARQVRSAAKAGARVISLPEMWNCPYDNALFAHYAEDEKGASVRFMSEIAKELGIVLIGGSIPESAADKLYNTCYVFGSDGAVIGKYRKRYLFDVNVKNGISFRESDVISAGDKLTVVDVEFAKIGVAICYDVRFPHLMTTMAEQGAQLIVLPASFSLSTGPYHWEILMRARALDFQLYFAACSSARNNMAKFKAYGHSMIVNPWGEICGAAAIEETVVFGEIDIDYIEQVRQEIPVRTQLVRNVTV